MKEQNTNVRCPNCGVSDVTYNIEKKNARARGVFLLFA